mgnify:CR=1 FL=1
MKEEHLTPGTALCSDTYYRFEGDILDVSLSDTQHITDRIYLSLTAFHRGALDTAFYLHGLKNVVLDFGGATLFLRGRIQPFIVDECENIGSGHFGELFSAETQFGVSFDDSADSGEVVALTNLISHSINSFRF